MTQESKEIDVRLWCIRILKKWYWILLCCLLCGAIGLLKYFSTTPKFSVESDIMIRSSETDKTLPQMELMQMVGIGGSKKIGDEIAVLTSRDAIRQIINELDIQTEYRTKDKMRWVGQYPYHTLTVVYPPTFTDTIIRTTTIDIKVRKSDYVVKVQYGRFNHSRHKVRDLSQPIQTCLGEIHFTCRRPLEQGERFRIKTLPMLSCIDNYKQEITAATKSKETNVITISTVTDMPRRAIDVINKEIEHYNLDAVMDKQLLTSNTAAFIDERLRLIEQELSTAEDDVERYKQRNGIVDIGAEARLYLSESTEYRKRAAEIETQLNLTQFVGDFVADDTKRNNLIPANLGISDESLVALINEYNNTLLRRMRIQRTATDDNPVISQMDNQLSLLRENVISSIANVRSTLLISKSDLDKRYNVVLNQQHSVPAQERQYIEVARRKQMKESLYLFLYEKREENALSLVSAVRPIKVIATPQRNPSPVGPRLKLIGLICLFLGVCIPIGIIYLCDLLNTKLTDDPKDLEQRMKIPFAGMLVQNPQGGHIVVKDGEHSVSAELFRSLRNNLCFMFSSSGAAHVILVTSGINGEGKSYVSANLAVALALLGKRVALVEMDVRKPALAEYFHLNAEGRLASYLSDSRYAVDDAIVSSDVQGLDLLPSGVVPPNPGELMLNERLDLLFAELRQRYDYIVVDSAPVAVLSDTFPLGRIADMTVYVSRARYTTYDLVGVLNDVASQKRLPNMVGVLNGVKADKNDCMCG